MQDQNKKVVTVKSNGLTTCKFVGGKAKSQGTVSQLLPHCDKFLVVSVLSIMIGLKTRTHLEKMLGRFHFLFMLVSSSGKVTCKKGSVSHHFNINNPVK